MKLGWFLGPSPCSWKTMCQYLQTYPEGQVQFTALTLTSYLAFTKLFNCLTVLCLSFLICQIYTIVASKQIGQFQRLDELIEVQCWHIINMLSAIATIVLFSTIIIFSAIPHSVHLPPIPSYSNKIHRLLGPSSFCLKGYTFFEASF